MKTREWAEFAVMFREKVISTKDGSGIYFLSETITSPTLPGGGCSGPKRRRR